MESCGGRGGDPGGWEAIRLGHCEGRWIIWDAAIPTVLESDTGGRTHSPFGVRLAVARALPRRIIDIMVGIRAQHDMTAMRAAVAALDYEDMGEAGVPGRIYFRRRAGAAFNIALVPLGGHLWTCNLALRDYLRKSPEAARDYAA